MEEPKLLRLQAPSGETRMVDVHDLTELDLAWILESFPDALNHTMTGYALVNVQMGYKQ